MKCSKPLEVWWDRNNHFIAKILLQQKNIEYLMQVNLKFGGLLFWTTLYVLQINTKYKCLLTSSALVALYPLGGFHGFWTCIYRFLFLSFSFR